jgi:molybdopterin synthase catalytic subunit
MMDTIISAPLRHSAIHDGPLPGAVLAPTALLRADHGAVASFLGVVRDHARGRAVSSLHYECYRPMAEAVLQRLISEAAERCDVKLSVSIVHGIGAMLPGDVSVAIHVGSAHRAAAFEACRLLIERLKQDIPIWKRERYTDGSEAWLQGS